MRKSYDSDFHHIDSGFHHNGWRDFRLILNTPNGMIPKKFTFGQSVHEQIVVDVQSCERPVSGDFYDDNWLVIGISVSVEVSQAKQEPQFLQKRLGSFSEQLHVHYDCITGSAEFSTLEGQLSLKLSGDGSGNIKLDGKASDAAGLGKKSLVSG